MTRIRLARQARVDQVTVLVDVVVIGLGLVLLGALAGWSGWLTVPMIVIGAVFLLVALLRLQGWRSLVWSRNLVVDAEGIRCESRKDDGFAVRWRDLAAVGLHTDDGVDVRFGLTLVCYPKTADLPGSGSLVPLHDNAARMTRLPRRAGLAEAIRDGAPGDWHRAASGWDVLVAAPEVAPQVIPAPAHGRPVVVNVGRGLAGQGLAGGAFAAFFGIVAVIGAVSSGGGMRIAFAVVGVPFLLVAVAVAASVPVLARRRYAVLDPYAFIWNDPAAESVTLPWAAISSIATTSTVVRGSALSNGRTLAHVVVQAKDRKLDLPLGAQPHSAEQIAEAVQQFAPRVWRGTTSQVSRFGLK